MGNWFNKGTGLVVLGEAARTAEAITEEFYFADPGGAEIIIEVSAVGAPAGQINGIVVQNKTSEGNFFDAFNFGALAINAPGRYVLIAYPGPPAAGLYAAAPVSQLKPTQGRLRITHSNANSITYRVKIRNLGE